MIPNITINQYVDEINQLAEKISEKLNVMPEVERIQALNSVRLILHDSSPFKEEPVDLVLWINSNEVTANDYNPNSVAPPEMKLLEHSITEDGYTQPIVSWRNGENYEVIDGFHRNRVGKESKIVKQRIKGYLPLTVVNENRTDKTDRIAATIRHNRARGKHKVEAMSDIVIELKRRNWSDDRIGKELGMDADEVLRLCQITGLAELFQNKEFSPAWDINENRFDGIGADIIKENELPIPENKNNRIFHTWEKWECHKSGFYDEKPKDGMTQEEGEEKYREFLANLDYFETSLKAVISTWKNSCEHYLTNDRMNRIAWLGQASVAHALAIPSCCRGGYNRLTDSQKEAADSLALKYLNTWLKENGRDEVTYEQALSRTENELY